MLSINYHRCEFLTEYERWASFCFVDQTTRYVPISSRLTYNRIRCERRGEKLKDVRFLETYQTVLLHARLYYCINNTTRSIVGRRLRYCAIEHTISSHIIVLRMKAIQRHARRGEQDTDVRDFVRLCIRRRDGEVKEKKRKEKKKEASVTRISER